MVVIVVIYNFRKILQALCDNNRCPSLSGRPKSVNFYENLKLFKNIQLTYSGYLT